MKTAKEFYEKYEDQKHATKYEDEIFVLLKYVFELMEEYAKETLSDYTDFLLDHGYCDTDVYCEPPTAIDRFMHPKLNK